MATQTKTTIKAEIYEGKKSRRKEKIATGEAKNNNKNRKKEKNTNRSITKSKKDSQLEITWHLELLSVWQSFSDFDLKLKHQKESAAMFVNSVSVICLMPIWRKKKRLDCDFV